MLKNCIRISFFIHLVFLSQIKQFLSQIDIKSNFYSRLSGFNSFEFNDSFILNSFDSISKLKCLSSCTKTLYCSYIVYENNRCLICKTDLASYMRFTPDGNSLIFKKKIESKGLINYWTFNGNVNDTIGNAHLYDGVNAALTTDRFGVPNSALRLEDGYYKIPSGVYFSGTQLSIMGWVKVRIMREESRLIDLGNGPGNENIVLSLSAGNTGTPFMNLLSGTDTIDVYLTNDKSLSINEWQHLACVFSFPYYFIYINGTEVTVPGSQTSLSSFSLKNVVRTSNFVGRNNWNYQKTYADIDDLKFFNRALSQDEIHFEMNNNL